MNSTQALAAALEKLKSNQPQEGIHCLEPVLQSHSPAEFAFALSGVCKAANGDLQGAFQCFQKELELFPSNIHSLGLVRALTSSSSSDVERAVQALIEEVERCCNISKLSSNIEHNALDRFRDVFFGKEVQVIGMDNVAIGAGSVVGDHSWLNVCLRDGQTRMRIGEKVLVGRFAVLSTAGEFEIGSFSVLAPRVYISDADHQYQDIQTPILMQSVTLNRRLIIEENCWIGINAVVTGNLTVGRGSVVAAGSVVTKSVPPFSVVAGAPARIIKAYNPKTKVWGAPPSESDLQEVPHPTREEYLKSLQERGKSLLIEPIVTGGGQSI